MLYRLFTENKNYEQVKKLVCKNFANATIIKTEGVWQDKSEHSLIIEIDYLAISNEPISLRDRIETLCFAIKKLNEQDKILVQRIESESKLV